MTNEIEENAEHFENDNLVLVCGKSASGKSASLRDLKNPEGVLYLNCESNKKLPFKTKFVQHSITEPEQIFEAFEAIESTFELDDAGNEIQVDPILPGIHTIVIDTLTFLMDMYESQKIYRSKNGMQAWMDFQQYFKKMMQYYVAKSSATVIFTAHVEDIFNKEDGIMETRVPVKGALKGNGIESFFSCIVMADKKPLGELRKYDNNLLNITEEEELVKYKHVFQTKITADTTGTRIRSPIGMWDTSETFIDNDLQLVIDRLHEYYKD